MEGKKIKLDAVVAGFKKAIDAKSDLTKDLAKRTVAGMLESGQFSLSDFSVMRSVMERADWNVDEVLEAVYSGGDAYEYADVEEEEFEPFSSLSAFEEAFQTAVCEVFELLCESQSDAMNGLDDSHLKQRLHSILSNRWMDPAFIREVASVN